MTAQEDTDGAGAGPTNSGAEFAVRLAGAIWIAALAGCVFYGVDRTRAAWAMGDVDPTAIIATVRVEYFWRVGLSAFIASVAGIGGWWWLGRSAEAPETALRWLGRLTLPIVGVCALLSVLWP